MHFSHAAGHLDVGCVILHETKVCSQPCGARGGTAKHEVSRCMRPGHAARHVEDVVSACMGAGHAFRQVEGVVSACM